MAGQPQLCQDRQHPFQLSSRLHQDHQKFLLTHTHIPNHYPCDHLPSITSPLLRRTLHLRRAGHSKDLHLHGLARSSTSNSALSSIVLSPSSLIREDRPPWMRWHNILRLYQDMAAEPTPFPSSPHTPPKSVTRRNPRRRRKSRHEKAAGAGSAQAQRRKKRRKKKKKLKRKRSCKRPLQAL